MTPADVRERLNAYLDDRMSPEEAREFLAWLEGHPDAWKEAEAVRRVWTLLGAYRDEPVPEGFADRVLAKAADLGTGAAAEGVERVATWRCVSSRAVGLAASRRRRRSSRRSAWGRSSVAGSAPVRRRRRSGTPAVAALDALPSGVLDQLDGDTLTQLASSVRRRVLRAPLRPTRRTSPPAATDPVHDLPRLPVRSLPSARRERRERCSLAPGPWASRRPRAVDAQGVRRGRDDGGGRTRRSVAQCGGGVASGGTRRDPPSGGDVGRDERGGAGADRGGGAETALGVAGAAREDPRAAAGRLRRGAGGARRIVDETRGLSAGCPANAASASYVCRPSCARWRRRSWSRAAAREGGDVLRRALRSGTRSGGRGDRRRVEAPRARRARRDPRTRRRPTADDARLGLRAEIDAMRAQVRTAGGATRPSRCAAGSRSACVDGATRGAAPGDGPR